MGATSVGEIKDVINALFKDQKESAERVINVFDVTSEFIKNFEGRESLNENDIKAFYNLINPLIQEFQSEEEEEED
ncbi:MAG: hypothetical protein AAGD88_18190 [Bacteroidota bacterium]